MRRWAILVRTDRAICQNDNQGAVGLSRSEVISARFAPHEKALVQAAAAVDGKPVSEFVHSEVLTVAFDRVAEILTGLNSPDVNVRRK